MIWSITKKELKKMVKQKGTLFWLIGFPIMFIIIFAAIFGGDGFTFDLHYTDKDQTVESKNFLDSVSKTSGFNLIKESDETKAIDDVKNGRSETYLVIPKGFGDNLAKGKETDFDFYYDGTANASQSVGLVQTLLNSISSEYKDQKVKATLLEMTKNPDMVDTMLQAPIQMKDHKEEAVKINAITEYVPGYTVMAVFFIVLNMSRVFIGERDSGMIARLISTPMTRFQYVIGMWLPNIFVVCIQIAVLFTFGHYVYGLQMGNYGPMILLSVVLALASTSLGLVVSFLARDANMAQGISQVFFVGGAALGGLWFPVSIMPAFMQNIAKATPQYWAHQGYMDIFARGATISTIMPSVYFLLGVTVISLLISIMSFKYFYKGAVR